VTNMFLIFSPSTTSILFSLTNTYTLTCPHYACADEVQAERLFPAGLPHRKGHSQGQHQGESVTE